MKVRGGVMSRKNKKDEHPGVKYLADRGISIKLAVQNGIEFLVGNQTRQLCDINEPSIKIPLRAANDKPRINGAATYTLRVLAQPGFNGVAKSKLPKMLCEKGKHNSCFFPAGLNWIKIAENPQIPITITEAPIKAISLSEEGISAVGLNGIHGFKAKVHGHSTYAPDLAAFNWHGRRVEIAPDSDYEDNPEVRRAVADHASELAKRGAIVYRVVIPHSPEGAKQGVDDFKKLNGIAAYKKLKRVSAYDDLLMQRTFTLDEMLEEFIYVTSIDRVSQISYPDRLYRYEHFERLTASSKEKSDDQKKSVAYYWLRDSRRKNIDSAVFAPGQPLFCTDPWGNDAINSWKPIRHNPPKNWKQLAKPIIEHIAYLVPNLEDRKQFLMWLAHMIQYPGEMPYWHVLMCTDGSQGIGRNLIAAVIGKISSPYAALHTDIEVLAGNARGKGFNGSLIRKIFVCVDEIHQSAFAHGGRRMMEVLKSTLTAETIEINKKYGDQTVVYNRIRVLILSNHIDAIPLDNNDRRILVIKNPNVPKEPKYYSDLYSLVNDPDCIASVWEYLRTMDLKHLIRGRAPLSEAKLALIEATEPPYVARIRELVDEQRNRKVELLSTKTIRDRLSLIEDYQFRDGMRRSGAIRYPKKVREERGGRQQNVWILSNFEKWQTASVEAVRRCLEEKNK
jgi:hypothetical protein